MVFTSTSNVHGYSVAGVVCSNAEVCFLKYAYPTSVRKEKKDVLKVLPISLVPMLPWRLIIKLAY